MMLTVLRVLASLAPLPSSITHSEPIYCINGTPWATLPSVRGTVIATCLLSMLGALMIILSYILIPDIRTKAREILVNLSIMDFMAAAANFAGVTANFDYYLFNSSHPGMSQSRYDTINNLCIAQAFFAMYGTLASVFWTVCIAVYIYLWIMLEGKTIVRQTVYAFYIICYGIPLIMSVWFVSTGKLGYARYGGSGWCSVILKTPDGKLHPYLGVIGNDIWIYLTIILVTLIFISLKLYIWSEKKSGAVVLSGTLAAMVQSVEMKLLLIPIFFILLRIWSLLLVIITIEARHTLSCPVVLAFLHLGGIGDSGQGIANAIIFGVFTPKVRRFFIYHLTCRHFCRSDSHVLLINTTTSSVAKYGTSLESNDRNTTLSDSSAITSEQEEDRKSLLA